MNNASFIISYLSLYDSALILDGRDGLCTMAGEEKGKEALLMLGLGITDKEKRSFMGLVGMERFLTTITTTA